MDMGDEGERHTTCERPPRAGPTNRGEVGGRAGTEPAQWKTDGGLLDERWGLSDMARGTVQAKLDASDEPVSERPRPRRAGRRAPALRISLRFSKPYR